MKLDLSSLEQAIKSFQLAVSIVEEDPKLEETFSADQIKLMRSGVIQHFEFCYELCWKMIRRYLLSDEGEDVNALSRKDLFRLAAKKQLIASPECWFVFHLARNETSHTYSEAKAQEVYDIAKQCLPEAQTLLANLEERL